MSTPESVKQKTKRGHTESVKITATGHFCRLSGIADKMHTSRKYIHLIGLHWIVVRYHLIFKV